jgi:prepilin signal peptidase PulO-like enzyme (type II secretory pathway)
MIFITILICLLALSFGSFANSLIWRLAKNRSLKGRSICPLCQKKILWHDNIPLVSFIRLKGKCRYCQKKILWQYPLVELSLMLLFLFAWFKFLNYQFLDLELLTILGQSPAIWLLIRDFLALFILIIVFVFDWRYFLIPVNLLIFSFPIFWVLNILAGAIWWWPIILSLIITSFFLLQFLITKGKGLGEGDIWLGAWLAFLLPTWSELLVAILIAYLLGSLVGIVLVISKKKQWQSKLPLGTFLVIGTILSLFWGKLIWFSYWNFFL